VKYDVLIMPATEAELEQAYLGLAERAPEAAVKWYNGILAATASLRTFPERCPAAIESKSFGHTIRQLLYGDRQHAYRILFDVSVR
jgi:plasmid stabilization system protein ParE